MSINDAVKFIQDIGKNDKLKDKIRGLGDSADLEDVVKLGEIEGLTFTVEELRVAFVKDWEVRRYFYKS